MNEKAVYLLNLNNYCFYLNLMLTYTSGSYGLRSTLTINKTDHRYTFTVEILEKANGNIRSRCYNNVRKCC